MNTNNSDPESGVRRKLSPPRRFVDFMNQKSDHECALLAAMGFSSSYIAARTKLSLCQITYRIRKAGLTHDNSASRLDFRNGVSPFSQTLLGLARQGVDGDLVKFLQRNT